MIRTLRPERARRPAFARARLGSWRTKNIVFAQCCTFLKRARNALPAITPPVISSQSEEMLCGSMSWGAWLLLPW